MSGRSVDRLAPVGRRVGEPELDRGCRSSCRRVAPVDDPRLHLGASQEARDVGERRPRTGADDAKPQSPLIAHVITQPPLTSIVAPLTKLAPVGRQEADHVGDLDRVGEAARPAHSR